MIGGIARHLVIAVASVAAVMTVVVLCSSSKSDGAERPGLSLKGVLPSLDRTASLPQPTTSRDDKPSCSDITGQWMFNVFIFSFDADGTFQDETWKTGGKWKRQGNQVVLNWTNKKSETWTLSVQGDTQTLTGYADLASEPRPCTPVTRHVRPSIEEFKTPKDVDAYIAELKARNGSKLPYSSNLESAEMVSFLDSKPIVVMFTGDLDMDAMLYDDAFADIGDKFRWVKIEKEDPYAAVLKRTSGSNLLPQVIVEKWSVPGAKGCGPGAIKRPNAPGTENTNLRLMICLRLAGNFDLDDVARRIEASVK